MSQPQREATDRLRELPVDEIEDGVNIRTRVDARLKASVREFGVLQPITVAWVEDHFECLYGHRRLAAARAAGLATIPAIVEPEPRDLALRQLAENLERRGLDPIEEAQALSDALEADRRLTQEDLGARFGRKGTWVANRLALLRLPEWTRERVASGHLTPTLALKARPRTNDGRGRPRAIPLESERGASRSVELRVGREEGALFLIGVDRELGYVDVVIEQGDRRILLTLSPSDSKLVGRRLVQAYQALAVAS